MLSRAPSPTGAYTLQQWRVRNGAKALLATYSGACRLAVSGAWGAGVAGLQLAVGRRWLRVGAKALLLHTRVRAVGRWEVAVCR